MKACIRVVATWVISKQCIAQIWCRWLNHVWHMLFTRSEKSWSCYKSLHSNNILMISIWQVMLTKLFDDEPWAFTTPLLFTQSYKISEKSLQPENKTQQHITGNWNLYHTSSSFVTTTIPPPPPHTPSPSAALQTSCCVIFQNPDKFWRFYH